jgi:hypothetical protein
VREDGGKWGQAEAFSCVESIVGLKNLMLFNASFTPTENNCVFVTMISCSIN